MTEIIEVVDINDNNNKEELVKEDIKEDIK